ncbi:MAG TPA: putative hydro-lyase [Pirellulales bacterium]
MNAPLSTNASSSETPVSSTAASANRPGVDGANLTAREVRELIRHGAHRAPTAGLARGFVQANVVIVPADWADEFALFCERNPQPCPLIHRTAPGDFRLDAVALEGDLRTDVPRYRVFRDGRPDLEEYESIEELWRDDFVGFLIGCSFTFEAALLRAGVPIRHIELGRNVPMFRTNVACRDAGRFSGPLVVSMRPIPDALLSLAAAITGRQPAMHGAPVHIGDPAALGIANVDRPDFGEAVPIHPGETPVFWACGVTPQLALLEAKPPIAITHSPGCMFITDLKDEQFETA